MVAVRCPMRECRRQIEVSDLAPGTVPADACLHLVAAWADSHEDELSRKLEAILFGLEGNREFTIRNLRPREAEAKALVARADREALDAAVDRSLHIVDRVAAFGDQHERAAASRELAQLIIGPDPILGGGGLR